MRRCLIAFAFALPLGAATVSQFNVYVPMRDGVRLSANVFRPSGDSRFPTILVRTPYNKGDAMTPSYQSFVNHGYAVVVQDVRGRYKSGGYSSPSIRRSTMVTTR